MNTFASYFPALVDAVVKATIILGLAGIAGLLLRNRSAALRHTVRACALGAVLLLPVLSHLVPAWHWQGLPRFPLAANQSAAMETPAALPVVPQSDMGGAELAPPQAGARATTQPSNGKPALPTISKLRPAMNWPQLIIMVWLLGMLLVALRLLVSRSRFARLIGKATPVDDPSWSSQIQEIAHLLGIRRSVALLESQDTEVPLTTGALQPKIILSPDYSEWSPLRRDAILHHELAHIRRLDTLAQALCQVAIATYWFHPLVWVTVRAMRAEREQACDDYVLAAGTRPSEYAHELLEIASSLRQPEFTAALAMAKRSQLEGRVMALLNPAQHRGSISQKTTLMVALLTLCAVLPLAAIQSAAPQKKSSDQRKAAAPTQTQSTPAAATDEEQPALPEEPQEATQPQPPPAPPVPPAAATPPVGGVVGGVPGGVRGGVVGGVPGGIRAVPAMPPAPARPQIAPATPQTLPVPSSPPAARLQSAPASPDAPQATPVPQAVPRPEAAPVAPGKPSKPSPRGVASPAPRAILTPHAAATSSALPALRAQLAAIHAQAGINPREVEALRAKIATIAITASATNAPLIAKLRSQTAAMSAQTAATSHQMVELRAQIAALAPIAAQSANSMSPKVAALRAQIAAMPRIASTRALAATISNTCGGDSSHPHSVEIVNDGNHKRWTASWSGQNCHVDLHSEGEITFNEDTVAIESISPGGFFEISDRHGDTLRQVRVTPSAGGLQFDFKVDGTEKPFDSEAKAWFSTFLTTMQRTTWQLAFPEPASR
jgi:beta-lactamase regulating signal transducer with metallopeptidase domain